MWKTWVQQRDWRLWACQTVILYMYTCVSSQVCGCDSMHVWVHDEQNKIIARALLRLHVVFPVFSKRYWSIDTPRTSVTERSCWSFALWSRRVNQRGTGSPEGSLPVPAGSCWWPCWGCRLRQRWAAQSGSSLSLWSWHGSPGRNINKWTNVLFTCATNVTNGAAIHRNTCEWHLMYL